MFNKDNITAEILDVFHIERPSCKPYSTKRPFHVLSRRLTGKAVFYQKNNTFSVNENSVLYIPSDVDYSQKSDNRETLIAIHMNILNHSDKKISLSDNPSDKVTSLFVKIYETWNSKCENYKYLCTALLYELFAEISKKTDDAFSDYPFLKKSVEYINENFREPLSVGALAKICGVSENYYRRIFGKCMGISPLKYINSKRIEAAKALIVSGYYRISEISDVCGFSEHKYFCSVFKKETGMMPTEYLKHYNKIKN